MGRLCPPRALEPPAPRAARGGSVTLSAAPPSTRRGPLRVLFFNEGNLGTYILGQSQLEEALRVGLEDEDQAVPIAATFAGLPPLGRWGRAMASRAIPGLEAHNLDLRTLRWHVVQSLRARGELRAELARSAPDVLLVHSQSTALLARGIMRRLPVVISLDATVRDWASMPAWERRGRAREIAPSMALERRALRGAALVMAWTHWAQRGVEAEEPRANVIAHHPGLDLRRWTPAAVRTPRERPRVLFVGGRFREKGGVDLLDAVQGLLASRLDLDIVTPAQVPPIEGVTLHRLEPSSPELLRLYQQADLVCLPTHGDTNPWVLLEAMACGTPAVSTPVGAIPELLDDGRAGTIVPRGDPRALREALTALLADAPRRAQLARAARERCEQRYDARRQFATLAGRMASLAGRAT